MLSRKAVKLGGRLVLALIIGLALTGFQPIPAQAQTPVIDLVLGGEGAISWNISNIQPGDSGTKTVELHNAGGRDGFVTIWISDIEETDYAGDGAALDDYLLFNLSRVRLSSNINFPAKIHELPQNTSGPNVIQINLLYAGETITLIWQWQFRETGQSQNDAQGDSLSFTINYMLEELPPDGGGGGVEPSYQWLAIDMLGKVTLVKVSSLGEFVDSYVVTDPDNKFRLEFNKGTKITCASGQVPRRIEMKVCEEPLLAPDGTEIIGPVYDLIGYTYDSASCSLILNKPAKLTLSYDPSEIPIGIDEEDLALAYYDEESGKWVELDSVVNTQNNTITASVSYFTAFAIIAPLAPPLSPPASAKFKLNDLITNPAQAGVGEPVTISIIIQNTGELEGSYTLTLKIDGRIEQSKETTLAGGESTRVSFTVIKDEPGTYTIAVGGLTGEFIVLAPASSPPQISCYWWVILLAVPIIALMIWFLIIRPRLHL
jgi:hypothetical protein